jgi:hypothetical protein
LRCFNHPGIGIIAIVITIASANGARMKAIPLIPQTITKTAAKPSNIQIIDDDFVFTASPEGSQQAMMMGGKCFWGVRLCWSVFPRNELGTGAL